MRIEPDTVRIEIDSPTRRYPHADVYAALADLEAEWAENAERSEFIWAKYVADGRVGGVEEP